MKKILKLFTVLTIMFLSVVCRSQNKVNSYQKFDYGSNSQLGKYLQTRDFNLYFEVYGKGAPVLVIHGNGGSISSMKEQIPWFSKKHQVIAADSRSQGKSKDAADSLSYEMMADDYNALMDSLHLDSAMVIGWSDGGIIGLLLAIRHPEKVRRLVITGANIRPDSTAVSAADIQSMKQQVLELQKQKQTPKIKNDTKLTRLMIDEPNISLASLQQIRCPVLVIGGDHDIIKTEHTVEIYRSIPGASLWILPGSGHDTCIRFKDDFNIQAERFFNK
ncbi:MAG: alpha/beta hydrolase [Bacteroidetes bacterium]|nr:alpha/beta hydrolase [Bacteroidota bacterium]